MTYRQQRCALRCLWGFALFWAFAFMLMFGELVRAEPYVGGMLTRTEIPELCDDFLTCSESSVSGSALIGFQLNSWLAVEASGRHIGSNFEGNNQNGEQTQFDLYGGDVAVVAFLPFANMDTIEVHPLIRVGALYTNEGGVDPILGLGLSMNFKGREVRALYEHAPGVVAKGEVEIFSIGLIWRFR